MEVKERQSNNLKKTDNAANGQLKHVKGRSDKKITYDQCLGPDYKPMVLIDPEGEYIKTADKKDDGEK